MTIQEALTDDELADFIGGDSRGAWRSETIGAIGAALARAQGDFDAAAKGATSHYGTYADLKSVIKAIQVPLSKHEIAYFQALSAAGQSVTCETVLIHSSGEWLRSSLTLTADDSSPQKQGSAATYARRYGLQAAVGLATEDDDADSAQGLTTPTRRPKKAPRQTKTAVVSEMSGDAVTVTDIEVYAKPGSDWTKRTITFSNGAKAVTFDDTVAQQCATFGDDETLCRIITKPDRNPDYLPKLTIIVPAATESDVVF